MFTWPEKSNYHASADSNVMVITIVEEVCAVESIDQIAATPGLDALFIGTSDLSFSLGLRGKQDHPDLQAAIDRVVAAARRNNVPIGRPAATAEQVAQYREQGFSLFQTKTELGFFGAGARQFLHGVGRSAAPEGKSFY
jgi:2-keto-3-deoxy-L-rhamnonate aldolase RhmA